MPEARLKKTRDAYVDNGDVKKTVVLPWRPPHENAAEQLVRRAGWNVIEGEHFDSDADHHRVIEGATS